MDLIVSTKKLLELINNFNKVYHAEVSCIPLQ